MSVRLTLNPTFYKESNNYFFRINQEALSILLLKLRWYIKTKKCCCLSRYFFNQSKLLKLARFVRCAVHVAFGATLNNMCVFLIKLYRLVTTSMNKKLGIEVNMHIITLKAYT